MVELRFGSIDVGVKRIETPAHGSASRGSFRILVLGNFSGGGSDVPALSDRKPVRVDRDNYEEVFTRMKVRVPLGQSDGQDIALQFRELDDMHPDHWLEQLELFSDLKSLKRRLANPKTFEATVAELTRAESPAPSAAEAVQTEAPDSQAAEMGASLLSASLAATSSTDDVTGSRSGSRLIDSLASEYAAPYVTPSADPRQEEYVKEVDRRSEQLARSILSHASMRSVESAWRGTSLLVSRLETDSKLSLDMLDVRRDEIAADLFSSDELSGCMLFKKLVEAYEDQPLTLVVVDCDFGATQIEAELLARLGKLAHVGGFRIVTAGSSGLVECDSFGDHPDPDDWTQALEADAAAAWGALRSMPEAGSIVLTAPRFLLRQPYGAKSSQVESFPFEELTSDSDHEAYPWGNGAYAVAWALGTEFTNAGSDWTGNATFELDRLPAYTRMVDDESEMTPCAEAMLVSRAAETLRAAGMTPMRSVRGSDSIQFGPIIALNGSQV
ncbi:MAG: type VI secretion system protein ImpC [Planctomycetota bacterium]|jgi:type VI secretion system protein ImpC